MRLNGLYISVKWRKLLSDIGETSKLALRLSYILVVNKFTTVIIGAWIISFYLFVGEQSLNDRIYYSFIASIVGTFSVLVFYATIKEIIEPYVEVGWIYE